MPTAVIRTITLQEYEQKDDVVLSSKQASLLRDRFDQYLTVTPSWGEGWLLKARQYVGTIVLDDLQIVIRPKTAVDNLFYMLSYAYELPQFRKEQAKFQVSDNLLEFIIVIFAHQVEQLVRRGVYRSYLEQEENHRFLRGKLMLGEQIRRNQVRAGHFYQQNCEFTADVLENQILKYTVWKLSHLDYEQATTGRRLRRLVAAFPETSLRSVKATECHQVIYTRLNEAYRSSIHLAFLLLRHLSLESKVGEAPFATFLFDMNRVFELFVARFLEQYLTQHYPDFFVEIQPQIWLGEDILEAGYPDIVLQYQGQRLIVLDTKYKRFQDRPSREDRNQMFMYCHTMALQQAYLIYPGKAAYRNRFPDVLLQALGLPLSGNLAMFRQRCAAFAQRFVGELVAGV